MSDNMAANEVWNYTANQSRLILSIGGSLTCLHLLLIGHGALRVNWKRVCDHCLRSLRGTFKSLWVSASRDDPLTMRVEKELHLRLVAVAQVTSRFMSRVMGIWCCGIVLDTARKSPRTMTFNQDLLFFSLYLLLQIMAHVPWMLSSGRRHMWYSACMVVGIAVGIAGDTEQSMQMYVQMSLIPQFCFGLLSLNTGLFTCWSLAAFIAAAFKINMTANNLECFDTGNFLMRIGMNTAITLLALQGAKSLIQTDVRRKIDQVIFTNERSATGALLDMLCDVIVELDATLTIADEAPQLSHMLLRSGRSLQGEQLQTFMPDQDYCDDYTRTMQAMSLDMPARVFHTKMRDSDGNSLNIEVFAVQFEGVDGLPRNLLGMREFTDLPPLAKLPSGNNTHAAAEARAASIMRKEVKRASSNSGNRGCSNPKVIGTPHETDWQGFQGQEVVSPPSSNRSNHSTTSNASDAVLRPGFRLTNKATRRLLLLNALASWNVRFKRIQCCELHCLTEDAQQLVREMHREACTTVGCDLDWQCAGCGVLDSQMVNDEDGTCALCGHKNSDAEHGPLQSTDMAQL